MFKSFLERFEHQSLSGFSGFSEGNDQIQTKEMEMALIVITVEDHRVAGRKSDMADSHIGVEVRVGQPESCIAEIMLNA